MGFPGGAFQCRRSVQSLSQDDSLEEAWQPKLVFLPGDSMDRGIPGYSPWVRKSDFDKVT